jgi:predicted alpha/beta-fold hydrolase
MELAMQKVYSPLSYEREFFTLSDGGTICIDWVLGADGVGVPKAEDKKSYPILVILAGLAGERDNVYNLDMIMTAKARGFKVVIIGYRGTSGMKLTSGKLYNLYCWEDIKEPLDDIYEKHAKTQNRKLHGYAVSMGGNILGHYMTRTGSESKLTSIATYGNIFDP